MTRNATLGVLTAALLSICLAQSVLNNDAIVKMVKAGLGEDIVVSTIKSQPGQYGTTADELIALKKAGVPDKIIAAMIDKGAAPSANPLVAAAPAAPAPAGAVHSAPAGTPPPVVSEVGVYYNKAGTWADLPPEVVNFKSGGVLKTIGTAGIVKGDVNGHINGLHSPNALKTPVELLVYTAEGVAITEYQLLRLRDQKDSREFRTMTGGVFHASGGATRDVMQFESKKMAPRTYQITLSNIGAGEYGLLPPTSGDGTGSTGRIGKLYSFRVIE
jgi:hypothetical protein